MNLRPACLIPMISIVLGCPASAVDDMDTLGVSATQRYLLGPVPPNNAVRIVDLSIEPHGIVGRHCHSGDEIGIVAEGTLTLKLGTAEYETKHQGDSFQVPPKTWMVVKNETDKPARLYSVLVVDNDGAWLKHDPKNCK